MGLVRWWIGLLVPFWYPSSPPPPSAAPLILWCTTVHIFLSSSPLCSSSSHIASLHGCSRKRDNEIKFMAPRSTNENMIIATNAEPARKTTKDLVYEGSHDAASFSRSFCRLLWILRDVFFFMVKAMILVRGRN